ncbi:rCG21223 [Rattus norvegicus]|uniref:RCG21223 n=1 Tax=Rattus norvegicus TaxID=10116 RepID=A6J1U5_RAT|nr:rCG21223 [Rattus norvegicus]
MPLSPGFLCPHLLNVGVTGIHHLGCSYTVLGTERRPCAVRYCKRTCSRPAPPQFFACFHSAQRALVLI